MSGLGGTRPSPGDTNGTGLHVRCTVCGEQTGPLGEWPEKCPQCGAGDERLSGELRQERSVR